MDAILIMELKGFEQIAPVLSWKMDRIDMTPERLRAISITITETMIQDTNRLVSPLRKERIGGDTWAFTFYTAEEALKYGCLLLRRFFVAVYNQGICYIKPSVALNMGNLEFKGGTFIDDSSIKAYRIADKGYPFDFYMYKTAAERLAMPDWVNILPPFDPNDDNDLSKSSPRIDWQNANVNFDEVSNAAFEIPRLVLDADTIYSKTPAEAIHQIMRQQSQCLNSVNAFGGPTPFDKSNYYLDYIKQVISILKSDRNVRWAILSYIPQDDAFNSYCWLELGRRLSLEFPSKFVFKAFILKSNQLRPFSYQLFDGEVLHLGLRKYSPVSGIPILSSAIMLRNKNIAELFNTEFEENWRATSTMDDKIFGDIITSINGITGDIKKNAYKTAKELLG